MSRFKCSYLTIHPKKIKKNKKKLTVLSMSHRDKIKLNTLYHESVRINKICEGDFEITS